MVGMTCGWAFGYASVQVVRERELLMRWAELNVFTGAVLRSHEGLLPEYNHQIWTDETTLAHTRRCVDLFIALRPYRRALMREAAERGWPLVRHPVLHFPHDKVVQIDKLQQEGGSGRIRQFLLGGDYMVVPVLEPGVERVRGYLPRGSWVSIWTDQVVHLSDGEWRELDAPLGKPVVWARSDAPSLAELLKGMRQFGLRP